MGHSSPRRTDQARDQFWFHSVRFDTVKSIVLDVAWGRGGADRNGAAGFVGIFTLDRAQSLRCLLQLIKCKK